MISCAGQLDKELPDELLVKVLLRVGLRSTAMAACTCHRLRHAAQQAQHACQDCQVFASAGTRGGTNLEREIRLAARRAVEGMHGGVDFAMLLVSGHQVRAGIDPAAILQSCLPQGVPVVGCQVAGVVSVAPDNQALEIDTMARGKEARGVAVLLGRMPNHHVRPFADTTGMAGYAGSVEFKRACEENRTPAAGVRTWLARQSDAASHSAASLEGAQQRPTYLVPSSVWLIGSINLPGLLVDKESDLHELLTLKGLLHELNPVEWFHKQKADVVVAGGIATGRLFFAPGTDAARLHPEWSHVSLKAAVFVGLAICESGGTNAAQQQQGTAGSAAEHSGAAGQLGKQPSANPAIPAAGLPQLGVRAACGALRGLSPLKCVAVLAGTRSPAPLFDVMFLEGWNSDDHLSVRPDKYALVVEAVDADGEGTPLSLWHVLGDIADQGQNPQVALWPAEDVDGQPLRSFGEAITSQSEVLLLYTEACRFGSNDQVQLNFEEHDQQTREHAERLISMHAAGRRVVAQIVDESGAGCVQQIPPLVKVLHKACVPAQQASLEEHLQQPYAEVYTALQANAAACGARSGPCCAALFSCNGRGARLFEDLKDGPRGEAKLLDEALQQSVPFVGGFFGGEIGPGLGSSWCSMQATHAAVHNLPESSAAATDEAQADGVQSNQAHMATTTGAGNGLAERLSAAVAAQLRRDAHGAHASEMQGWTSMYAMLG